MFPDKNKTAETLYLKGEHLKGKGQSKMKIVFLFLNLYDILLL